MQENRSEYRGECVTEGCTNERYHHRTRCTSCYARRQRATRAPVEEACRMCGMVRVLKRPSITGLCGPCSNRKPAVVKTCGTCGKTVERCPSQVTSEMTFCSRECVYKARQSRAVGNSHINGNGYRVIHIGSGYRLEHRYVMEQALGRSLLRSETVHHINGDRLDNRLENLELWASRHKSGQRASDLVADAVQVLRTYRPDLLKERDA